MSEEMQGKKSPVSAARELASIGLKELSGMANTSPSKVVFKKERTKSVPLKT